MSENAEPRVMNIKEILEVIGKLKDASEPGKVEDGTRIHVRYEKKADSKVSERAKEEAKRASELGLPSNAYTGRVSRVWEAKDGSIMLNMYVELERDHTYRSFNINKGKILHITILGD